VSQKWISSRSRKIFCDVKISGRTPVRILRKTAKKSITTNLEGLKTTGPDTPPYRKRKPEGWVSLITSFPSDKNGKFLDLYFFSGGTKLWTFSMGYELIFIRFFFFLNHVFHLTHFRTNQKKTHTNFSYTHTFSIQWLDENSEPPIYDVMFAMATASVSRFCSKSTIYCILFGLK